MANPMQFFFSISQYTCEVIVVLCCMNSTISHHFLSQKRVVSSSLADVCLNFIGMFGECVCASIALAGF
jgi:hypothetical protein